MVLKEAICADNGEDTGILFHLFLFSVPFFLNDARPMVRPLALAKSEQRRGLRETDKPVMQPNLSSRFSTGRSK